MDGESMSMTRWIWISLTVVVVVAAAWFGITIAQTSLEPPETPADSVPENPGG